ncbi:MAG: DUF1641 domain-containing protein [Actinomycetes bacterium]
MTETLERPTISTDDRLDQISAQVAELTAALHRQQAERQQLTELLGEVNELARPVMDVAMTRFAEFDEKGYFAFAKESAGVVDHVVTSFSPDDVKALGDNVVTILQTVREMTQPEVMKLVRRTAETAQDADEGFTTPPSTFALLRQMRDPEVRRGLARVMSMLQTVGADTHPSTTPVKN